MSQCCPLCPPGVAHDASVFLCPVHVVPLEPCPPATGPTDEPASAVPATAPPAPLAPPAAGGADTPWSTLVCWNCGLQSVNAVNTECLRCRKRLVPPRLVLAFRFGSVELDLGGTVELGREGDHAQLFRSFDNVSRRHAVIGFDPDGRPWIKPLNTPNGTFCVGRELAPNIEHPLRNGQRLRFALHAAGTVTVYALPNA